MPFRSNLRLALAPGSCNPTVTMKIPSKLLYTLIPVFIAGIFLSESVFTLAGLFGLRLDFSVVTFSLENLRTLLIIGLVFLWRQAAKERLRLGDLPLSQKLWRLTALLTANFLGAFLLKLVFPDFIEADIAPAGAGADLAYRLFHNLAGLLAIFTLVPILMILRQLIFYKQRRTTRLYFNLFFLLLILSTAWVYSSGQIVNFSGIWQKTADSSVYNAILVWSLSVITLFLSFRNDWITYLPRRQKFIYFFAGIFVFVEIITVRDVLFDPYLQRYSLIVANFAEIVWVFLLLYGGLAMITLLMHLPTARAVDRKLKEVNSLYGFTRKLNTQLDYQKLPQMITQLTAEVLGSQSTWLEMFETGNNKLTLISHINLTQQQILNNPFDRIEGLNHDLVYHRKPLLINDMTQNPQWQDLLNWKKDLRSLVAAPLFSSREQLMGIIYASKSQSYGFDNDDVSLLEGFANQSAIALENAQLWQSSLERERLEQELRVAREVQLKLLPQSLPHVPGFELERFFLTANEVGGDYYDFIQFADGQPGVVIGDVSGKGTSAAFYMAEFKGVIQTLASALDDPKELVCRANRIFYATIERKNFLTAIVGKFIPGQKTFQFVRAGHSPLIFYRHSSAEIHFLQPQGLGIGMDPGSVFDALAEVHSVQFQAGDFLLLFTDGLVEARNHAGEEFGEERVASLARRAGRLTAAQIKGHILDEITAFIGDTPLHDDLTFMVIKFKGF